MEWNRHGPNSHRDASVGIKHIGIYSRILKLPKLRVWHFLRKEETVGRGHDKVHMNFECLMIFYLLSKVDLKELVKAK